MIFNFEFYLTLAVIVCGLVWLVDILFFARSRYAKQADAKHPVLVEYARSFFPVLLIVLLLRSFLAEPFRIPSGSDEPTLLVGDFILVNKYVYGLRLPVLHNKFLSMSEPRRGDILVFRWPVDPSIDFIKRVVGVPGDQISYVNKQLYINGQLAPQKFLNKTTDMDENNHVWPVDTEQEDLLGVKHKIYLRPDVPARDFSVIVPPGEYFVMGDNRDSSYDSRYWGFVPEANITGKAIMLWFSWDKNHYKVRWDRIGKEID